MGPRGAVETDSAAVTEAEAGVSVDGSPEPAFELEFVSFALVSIGEASGIGNARSFAISLFADLGCISSVFILASCVRVTADAFVPVAGEIDVEPIMSC